jgi:hypothetical protein
VRSRGALVAHAWLCSCDLKKCGALTTRAPSAIRKRWAVWFNTSRLVAQRVSHTIKVCVHQIKHFRVAPGCRAAAGLPSPAPLDDRRAMISWERMVQREYETRTRGCVAWSLAVCAEARAKPVMDACLYRCSHICGVQRR